MTLKRFITSIFGRFRVDRPVIAARIKIVFPYECDIVLWVDENDTAPRRRSHCCVTSDRVRRAQSRPDLGRQRSTTVITGRSKVTRPIRSRGWFS